MQTLHRIRSQLVSRRTAQTNQIRGLLLEYGVVIPQGRVQVRKAIPAILEDAGNELTTLSRTLLHELYEKLVHLDTRIASLEARLQSLCAQDKACQRLPSIPGVGLLSATAMVAAIGDISAFSSGRELAAWLGLVPRQHSTGGKPALLGIGKRGNSYLRRLLVHGGRSVVRVSYKPNDKRNQWVSQLEQRRGKNITAVAVANKNARIAWALPSQQTTYQGMAA